MISWLDNVELTYYNKHCTTKWCDLCIYAWGINRLLDSYLNKTFSHGSSTPTMTTQACSVFGLFWDYVIPASLQSCHFFLLIYIYIVINHDHFFLIMKKRGIWHSPFSHCQQNMLGWKYVKDKKNKCNILGLSAAFEDYLLKETTTIWNGAKKCNFYKALSY